VDQRSGPCSGEPHRHTRGCPGGAIGLSDPDDQDQPGKRWIQRSWKVLFEQMLEDWYTDPALWPRNRTIKMFREWCEIRIHSIVLDCGDTPIEYED
jgi:hypothetical protein